MRGFLVLCLVSVATAAKLGYDYRPGNGIGTSGHGLGGGLLGGSGGSLGSSGGLLGGSSGSLGSSGGHSSLGGGLNLGGGLGRGISSGRSIGSGSHSVGLLSGSAPVLTEYNKEYYFHSAPEEDLHDGGASERVTNTLKKNLRVVFIKAPENNHLTKAALNIARQATEDRTAIYVLTKENDVSDLSQQIQQIQEIRSLKPEVRFIKYRTSQDAINAQRAIQAQYDALGGTSNSSNEGIAPVLNYASAHPSGSHIGSSSELASAGTISSGSIAAPSGSYIPPKSSYLPPVAF